MICYNRNPFLTYNTFIIDASNPNANLANIPGDGTTLATLTEIGPFRNVFSQATNADRPVYLRDYVNGQNVIYFAGGSVHMTAPYDITNNGYLDSGDMTITVVWKTNTVDPGVNNRLFGRPYDGIGDPNGFSMGQVDDMYVFTAIGAADAQSSPVLTAGSWETASIKYYIAGGVEFYQDGDIVSDASFDPNGVSTADLILGGFNPSIPNLNFDGYLRMLAVAPKLLTNDQIKYLADYGNSLVGV